MSLRPLAVSNLAPAPGGRLAFVLHAGQQARLAKKTGCGYEPVLPQRQPGRYSATAEEGANDVVLMDAVRKYVSSNPKPVEIHVDFLKGLENVPVTLKFNDTGKVIDLTAKGRVLATFPKGADVVTIAKQLGIPDWGFLLS